MKQSDNFSIRIKNQKWLFENEEEDLCSHGEILLVVNGCSITETGTGDEWGVSESALALLRTIGIDYRSDPDKKYGLLLHGCGTTLMMGCPISIHWTVMHKENRVFLSNFVKITTTDPETGSVYYPNQTVVLDQNEYKRQIVRFAVEAKSFYDTSKSKKFYDDSDKESYELFWEEYNQLLEKNLL